jgi:hypothetical protein
MTRLSAMYTALEFGLLWKAAKSALALAARWLKEKVAGYRGEAAEEKVCVVSRN